MMRGRDASYLQITGTRGWMARRSSLFPFLDSYILLSVFRRIMLTVFSFFRSFSICVYERSAPLFEYDH
jgi:hypothetical protein